MVLHAGRRSVIGKTEFGEVSRAVGLVRIIVSGGKGKGSRSIRTVFYHELVKNPSLPIAGIEQVIARVILIKDESIPHGVWLEL